MSYQNPTNPGSILSSSNIAKGTKELLNKEEKKQKPLDRSECGCKNPAVGQA